MNYPESYFLGQRGQFPIIFICWCPEWRNTLEPKMNCNGESSGWAAYWAVNKDAR